MVDVVHQVITFLRFDGEEIAANKEDVGRALCFVDIAQCLLCFRWSFAILDVDKLVVS